MSIGLLYSKLIEKSRLIQKTRVDMPRLSKTYDEAMIVVSDCKLTMLKVF